MSENIIFHPRFATAENSGPAKLFVFQDMTEAEQEVVRALAEFYEISVEDTIAMMNKPGPIGG